MAYFNEDNNIQINAYIFTNCINIRPNTPTPLCPD